MTTSEADELAERFESHRPRLRALAYRMLGGAADAEDAVQETWIRLGRASSDERARIDNLGAWLTTVIARVCLNGLRSRTTRAEVPLEPEREETRAAERAPAGDEPEGRVELADSVGLAMLVVLDTLEPAERVAFVLHDMFDVPFGQIAVVVGRTPDAARQLASRARRRVRQATMPAVDLVRQREIVDAFLAAAREGEFEALLTLLDPDAVTRADEAAAGMGIRPTGARGADAVARIFSGRAVAARRALVDNAAAAVWAPEGRVRVVFEFTVVDDRIVAIDLSADPERLAGLDVVLLDPA